MRDTHNYELFLPVFQRVKANVVELEDIRTVINSNNTINSFSPSTSSITLPAIYTSSFQLSHTQTNALQLNASLCREEILIRHIQTSVFSTELSFHLKPRESFICDVSLCLFNGSLFHFKTKDIPDSWRFLVCFQWTSLLDDSTPNQQTGWLSW